jgi:hypothetical protein
MFTRFRLPITTALLKYILLLCRRLLPVNEGWDHLANLNSTLVLLLLELVSDYLLLLLLKLQLLLNLKAKALLFTLSHHLLLA